MYVVYCQNKPKSEHIVSEFIETYFEVKSEYNYEAMFGWWYVRSRSMTLLCSFSCRN